MTIQHYQELAFHRLRLHKDTEHREARRDYQREHRNSSVRRHDHLLSRIYYRQHRHAILKRQQRYRQWRSHQNY